MKNSNRNSNNNEKGSLFDMPLFVKIIRNKLNSLFQPEEVDVTITGKGSQMTYSYIETNTGNRYE